VLITTNLKCANTSPSLLRMSNNTKTTYAFIPGKNWKLSLAEMTSFLEARDNVFEVSEFSRTFFSVKMEGAIDASTIADFGGILKIGEIAAIIPTEIVERTFLQKSGNDRAQFKRLLPLNHLVSGMLRSSSEKSIFGVSVYWAESSFRSVSKEIHRFLGSLLKEKLREQGEKFHFLGFSRNRDLPQLSPVEVLKKGFVENSAEILFCIGKRQALAGNTVAVHNPFEFQKRDVGKPVQRKIFGMSPRLAKILINLAHCTARKVLLDPFCGVGTILQEALLLKAKVVGIDINPWCAEAARKNLEWLKQEYSLEDADYTILRDDARKLGSRFEEEVDCIATEPDLGPALRQMPTTPYATKIIDKLKPLYRDFLVEGHKALKERGFLVFVTPFIKTRSGKPVTMQIEEVASAIGFKTVNPFRKEIFAEEASSLQVDMGNLIDVEERHKIGREIHILQK
jgi:tRNA G10  N-methylase Trm11